MNTASAIINFYSRLGMTGVHLEKRLSLLSPKRIVDIRNWWRGLTSKLSQTPLEACFAFSIDDSDYIINTDVPKDMSYSEFM